VTIPHRGKGAIYGKVVVLAVEKQTEEINIILRSTISFIGFEVLNSGSEEVCVLAYNVKRSVESQRWAH
jgi:diacylglycerol kinase